MYYSFSSLLNKTSITQQYLHQGLSLNEIAIAQNVKLNTIEDHILELFIKGYEKITKIMWEKIFSIYSILYRA